ncbi:MAG: tripartite tricarboxylate transporter substrate binding protein [Betaproteobacteria bacterium]|nr:tripartite tricarboxylate transporter substrate binding protein [Betaproteobacteria bacterium]
MMFFRLMLIAGALCAGPITAARAQSANFPSKPIRILVPFAPGGGADLMARLVTLRMADKLGQPFVVDNRPAASGIVATELAARAAPDGYTMLTVTSNHAGYPHMYKKLPFDITRDFEPVTQATASPLVLVVHPSVPVNTMSEFLAHARANPGKLNYGTSGAGGPPHIAGEMLKSMAKINLTAVTYKGVAPALTAAIGNEVQMTFTNLFSGQPHIKGGRLKVLAVTSARRLQAAPDWPTVAESGVPGYEAGIWFGFMLPGGTGKPIVDLLSREITGILKLPEVSQTFISQGGEVIASSPQDFRKTFLREVERLGRVIREAGIKAE